MQDLIMTVLFMNVQDMVVEFARMNSFQVLEETEKAVCHVLNPSMVYCYNFTTNIIHDVCEIYIH